MTGLSSLVQDLAMGSRKGTTSRKTRPSFIEEARRRQIVETAIVTIAERGSDGTTLAGIAKDAGISKGVISYHFESKDELIANVLGALVSEPAEFIKERVDAETTAAGRLRAYVLAFFDFMLTHRAHYVALVELWGGAGVSEGREQFNLEAYEPSRRYLAHILESGVRAGEFRRVDPSTTASVIQGAIDGVMLQWVFEPTGLDVPACRQEILDMIRVHLSRERAAGPRPPRSADVTLRGES